jgi:hypothetical protein
MTRVGAHRLATIRDGGILELLITRYGAYAELYRTDDRTSVTAV